MKFFRKNKQKEIEIKGLITTTIESDDILILHCLTPLRKDVMEQIKKDYESKFGCTVMILPVSFDYITLLKHKKENL